MNAPTSRKGPQALDIKSATIYTVRLVLHSADTTELLEALDLRMQGAGAFFQNEPVVIDSTAIPDPIDWEGLITALRHHQLHPIGMMGQADQQIAAAQYGLPAVELSSTKTTIDLPEPEPEPEPAEPITQAAPMIVRQPLRSGQRLYAPDGDLIIAGMVGQGAEIIATGNIYVHGPLRGKAIAGANGDTNAFIVAAEFDPELIAIAGVYSVIEDPSANPYHKQGVVIQLEGESLKFEPLS
ncbi:septum site-determining protein MinC [Paenalcaligenes faecalis]|uniref:septum site-determining protein MinC n=1 Tax=Paenalcaligenes faecalis TaxID=2980099 RepID=UPI0022B9A401|nr:septum site-determining protein MinC [Paenalcaligenes faecalis]